MGLIAMTVVEELTDVKLYEHEAQLFRRKIVDGDRIGRMFERFAGEEKVHLESLRGMATIDEIGKTAPQKPPFSASLRDTLRTHVERELRSIRACEYLLAKLTDSRQRLLIKGIMADEKEHLKACLKYLKYVRPR
jgi:rubrerythrin